MTHAATITGHTLSPTDRTDSLSEALNRRLLILWDDLERSLEDVPFIDNIYNGQATLAEYQALLGALMQLRTAHAERITGGLARIGEDHATLKHRFAEHLGNAAMDCKRLHAEYITCGGRATAQQPPHENGNAQMLEYWRRAHTMQSDPRHLLGTMFIMEGLQDYLVPHWLSLLPPALAPEHMRFSGEHRATSTSHWSRLDDSLAILALTNARVEGIVKAAQDAARCVKRYLVEAGSGG